MPKTEREMYQFLGSSLSLIPEEILFAKRPNSPADAAPPETQMSEGSAEKNPDSRATAIVAPRDAGPQPG